MKILIELKDFICWEVFKIIMRLGFNHCDYCCTITRVRWNKKETNLVCAICYLSE
jgi:hypothetical protein